MALRYGIIGTGAIGGYYGGRLLSDGQDVRFLARSDAAHIRAHGLVLDSVQGRVQLPDVPVCADATELGPCDVVLVAIKTTGNDAIPDLVAPALAEGGVVVLMQNGLGMEEDLAARMPQTAIAAGVCSICADKIGAGRIRHQAGGQLILAGATGGQDERLDRIVADIEHAGIPAKRARSVAKARWSKLVWNIPFNGMSVVLGADTSVLTAAGPGRDLTLALMHEVLAGARACGADLPDSLPMTMIEATAAMPAYWPSMWHDWDCQRQLELHHIYERPLTAAADVGKLLPRTQQLYDQLRLLVARRDGIR